MPTGIYKRTLQCKKILSLSKKGNQNGFKKGQKSWNKGLMISGMSGKKRSEESKKLVSGENNYRWIKDRTKLKVSERKDLDVQYMYWTKEVKKRDKWKCRLLNSDCKSRLESHHIFNWTDYPKLRYLLTNGITLCHFHHPRRWEEEKRLIPIFQELVSISKE